MWPQYVVFKCVLICVLLALLVNFFCMSLCVVFVFDMLRLLSMLFFVLLQWYHVMCFCLHCIFIRFFFARVCVCVFACFWSVCVCVFVFVCMFLRCLCMFCFFFVHVANQYYCRVIAMAYIAVLYFTCTLSYYRINIVWHAYFLCHWLIQFYFCCLSHAGFFLFFFRIFC